MKIKMSAEVLAKMDDDGVPYCQRCHDTKGDDGWITTKIYRDLHWDEGEACGIPDEQDRGDAYCSWRCLAEDAAEIAECD